MFIHCQNERELDFDPDVTQLDWVMNIYPRLKANRSLEIFDCTIRPGEVLYFPDRWIHATLNGQDYNFFVSLFIDPQLIPT